MNKIKVKYERPENMYQRKIIHIRLRRIIYKSSYKIGFLNENRCNITFVYWLVKFRKIYFLCLFVSICILNKS
jgi:hypothetical protein